MLLLKIRLIRLCLFHVCVCRDVFNYLFSSCGVNVSCRPGKLYNRSDFCDDFFLIMILCIVTSLANLYVLCFQKCVVIIYY